MLMITAGQSICVLEKGLTGEVYNIGGSNEWENIKIIKKIIALLGKETNDPEINDSLIEYVRDRPGHDRRYAIDPAKIIAILGWKQEVTFEKGLHMTVRWYLDNPDWIRDVISGECHEFYKKNYQNR